MSPPSRPPSPLPSLLLLYVVSSAVLLSFSFASPAPGPEDTQTRQVLPGDGIAEGFGVETRRDIHLASREEDTPIRTETSVRADQGVDATRSSGEEQVTTLVTTVVSQEESIVTTFDGGRTT